MALPADGDDVARRPIFGRERGAADIFRVVERHIAMAGEAVERKRGKGAGLRVNGRRMATGAAVGESSSIPVW